MPHNPHYILHAKEFIRQVREMKGQEILTLMEYPLLQYPLFQGTMSGECHLSEMDSRKLLVKVKNLREFSLETRR
jgi:hypothetical protein